MARNTEIVRLFLNLVLPDVLEALGIVIWVEDLGRVFGGHCLSVA